MLRGKTVEFEHNGHRVLGFQYGGIEKYSRVQLRTPVVPTLVITPRTGAFEPDRFTPIEDATITRNTVGAETCS
jgi:hypothetical protein